MKILQSRVLIVLLVLLCLLPVLFLSSSAEERSFQVEGRVFTENNPLPGAVISAYTSYERLLADDPVAVSRATNTSGVYRMQLPAGHYYFTAKGAAGGKDYFAYLGANPLHLGNDLWIAFMANEIKRPSYGPGNGEVKGVVTYKGSPVKNAHIAFYKLENTKFKGIGYKTEIVNEDGVFLFPLPPDRYVIIARKTAGNEIRPLADGDLYCYYPLNPLEIKPGKSVSIDVPCYPKAARTAFSSSPRIKANDYATIKSRSDTQQFGIRGRVTNSRGEAIKGIYVLAYKVDAANSLALTRSYRGVHETENASKTDGNGHYFIPLEDDGEYAVIARSLLGAGTPKANEIYGVYRNTFRKGLPFRKGQSVNGIDITVVTPLGKSGTDEGR